MNLSADPEWENRDRLVFSKAHGGYGLYAILADLGYLKQDDWQTFYNGSFLSGCIERSEKHAIEASCGSLGHGLPMAAGMAFGAKLQKKGYRVYCIVGDGEMQEGSNWESIQFAVKYELTNLTVIVDHNKLQAMDYLDDVLTIKGRKDDLQKKFRAFGFATGSCRGHHIREMASSIQRIIGLGKARKKPQVIIADTIKGYGLLCMENIPKFHFRLPSGDELKMGTRYE